VAYQRNIDLRQDEAEDYNEKAMQEIRVNWENMQKTKAAVLDTMKKSKGESKKVLNEYMIEKEVKNIKNLGEILKSYPKAQLAEKDRELMQQYKRYIDLLPLIVKSVDFTNVRLSQQNLQNHLALQSRRPL